MSPVNVVTALGPGTNLSKLGQFESSYKTASDNFASLLQYPFLQSIILSETQKAGEDLRSIAVDGSSRFFQLTQSNVSISQQVVTFGKTAPALLKQLTIAGYAEAIKPLVDQYAAEAAASASDNEEFFANFRVYISDVDTHIALMTDTISDLSTRISNTKADLANANVGKVIGDVIKALFKIASGPDGDVQLATLLQVGVDTLTTSFSRLWEDQARLKALLRGLNALKENLTQIKSLFSSLSTALSGILTDSQSLLSTWSEMAERLQEVAEIDRKASELELTKIVADWDIARNAATKYINAVSGYKPTLGKSLFSAARAAAQVSLPKLPRTKGEIKMASLITRLYPAELKSPTHHYAPAQAALRINANLSDSDKEKFLKAAGPPARTQETLDNMALETSGVLKQFTDLLQIPYLDQLQCTDPENPSEKINIQVMVSKYQKMYFDLQQKTVPLVQDLQTYSNAQLLLLPKLVTTTSAGPGEVTVPLYLSANKTLQEEYKTTSDEIFKDSLQYKQKWDNAISAVKQSIEECKTNITSWEATIKDLNEQVKKLVLKAVLLGAGALLLFAAAAFLPGGILVSGLLVAGGVALIGMTIDAIQQIGKLNETINNLKALIESARDTQKKLEYLLPFMQRIADSLTGITGVWSDISQSLNDITAWNILLASPSLLPISMPDLNTDWTKIKEATQKYMDIITGRA